MGNLTHDEDTGWGAPESRAVDEAWGAADASGAAPSPAAEPARVSPAPGTDAAVAAVDDAWGAPPSIAGKADGAAVDDAWGAPASVVARRLDDDWGAAVPAAEPTVRGHGAIPEPPASLSAGWGEEPEAAAAKEPDFDDEPTVADTVPPKVDSQAPRPDAPRPQSAAALDDESERLLGAAAAPLELPARGLGSAAEHARALPHDFGDDVGHWSDEDYAAAASRLFGDSPHHGEDASQRQDDDGFTPFNLGSDWLGALDSTVPGFSKSVTFYYKGETVFAAGFVPLAACRLLRESFPQLDFARLQVTLPERAASPEGAERPCPLPPAFSAVHVRDKVDLRRFCSPVADQGQTGRAAAFALTHALELAAALLGAEAPRLSSSYVMLELQRALGDANDHAHAHRGGDGLLPGASVLRRVAGRGSCELALWPDDGERPSTSDERMASDARSRALPVHVIPIDLYDAKRVLSAGCPLVVTMSLGPGFANVGRDGLIASTEAPTGQHGAHAMLAVGYIGNWFILKSSWGTAWGDGGYVYVPKKVLRAANASLVALLLAAGPGRRVSLGAEAAAHEHPIAAPPPAALPLAAAAQGRAARPVFAGAAAFVAPVEPEPPPPPPPQQRAGLLPCQAATADMVACPSCHAEVMMGRFCRACGAVLARFCTGCGADLAGAHACATCGKPAR